jgi:hypothetical protein
LNSVREILDKAIKKMPNSQKIRGQMIMDAWPQVAGTFIAHKTEALFMEKGHCISGWRTRYGRSTCHCKKIF